MQKELRARKKNRLSLDQYDKEGYYFITFCTYKKICCLSYIVGEGLTSRTNEIEQNKMNLSSFGHIIESQISALKQRYMHINVESYVIMPNHVHMLLHNKIDGTRIGIIGYISALKTLSARDIRKNGFEDFKWQKSFYDRVIRTEEEYNGIIKYIEENPMNWETDEENTE